MAKDRNTLLKHQREMEKKRKAQDKRARRQKKKEEAANDAGPEPDAPSDSEQ